MTRAVGRIFFALGGSASAIAWGMACAGSRALPDDGGGANSDAGGPNEAGPRVDATDARPLDDADACPYALIGMPPDFALTPDAAPRTCTFTPADVACDANSDCTLYEIVSCGCYNFAIGVSASNTAVCSPPPCAEACPAPSWVTQDCNVVPSLVDALVGCVDHRCLTRSPLGAE